MYCMLRLFISHLTLKKSCVVRKYPFGLLIYQWDYSTDVTPSYNHIQKADFLYFEVEAPYGINIIVFRDSSVTCSAKIIIKLGCVFLVINLEMLQNGN